MNFVRIGDAFQVRTFERGVEGETLSCGTGSVASAAVARRMGMVGDEVFVETRGGPLLIIFEAIGLTWTGRRPPASPES